MLANNFKLPLLLFCLLDIQAGSARQLERKVASYLLLITRNDLIVGHLHVISTLDELLYTPSDNRLNCTEHTEETMIGFMMNYIQVHLSDCDKSAV